MIAAALAIVALAASPGHPDARAATKARSAEKAQPAKAPASGALAGAAAQASPVHVDAAEVRYAFQRHEVIFTGKPVTLTRDDARLNCARLVAKNDEAGEIVTATCEGDVRLVRGERTVTCQRGIYENAAARVTCEGDAVLRDRGTEARADRLVYELRTDEVRLEAAAGQGPVRITLPGEEVEARRRELEQRRQQRAEERKK